MANPLKIAVRKFAPFESAVQKIWENFRRETNTTLQMEMVSLELHDLYHSTVKEGGLKSGEWDLAIINTDWIHEAYETGGVEDLTPYLNRKSPESYPEGWCQSLLELQQFDGAVTGLPFHDGPECLIYRKDLFNDKKEQENFYKTHKKPLQPPQTWEDFVRIAEFFQRPAEGLYGTVFAGFPDGHNTVFDFSLQLWTRGGELTDSNGKVQINTEAACQGLEFYRKIFNNDKAIHPGSRKLDSVKAGEAFARGEIAMMVNWFGFASVCEVSDQSMVKGKVDITHLPKDQNASTASLNVYYLYVMAAGSTQKQAAYDFLKYAVNARNDKLLTLEGGIGCRLSTWKDPEVNAVIPYYHKLEALHHNARALPQKSNWAEIAAVIDDVVLQAVNTERSVGGILQEGQQKLELQDK